MTIICFKVVICFLKHAEIHEKKKYFNTFEFVNVFKHVKHGGNVHVICACTPLSG